MIKNSPADFTNWQVLVLAKSHPGARISDLVGIAKGEMPDFAWTYDKIRNAATRLSRDGRVEVEGARLWPIL